MRERLIEPVKCNTDKALTYRQMKGRYNKAMKEGFYFEAIAIDYAMIEDRLRSFIYHIGGLNTRNSQELDIELSKHFLITLYNKYKGKKNTKLKIDNISTKYSLIHAVIEWVSYTEGAEDKYQVKLKNACESLDADDIFNCIDELGKWCDYRNEIIHGLMNKKIESLNSKLAEKAAEGMTLATRIDSYVDIVSKGHTVRQSLNLKTE